MVNGTDGRWAGFALLGQLPIGSKQLSSTPISASQGPSQCPETLPTLMIPAPTWCRFQLPTHAGPRCPARWSVSGSLCNTRAPTHARPWRTHLVLKKPVYTAALGGRGPGCSLVCPQGEEEGAGTWAQQGQGSPVGHQTGHAGLQGTGCPSPSGQQVAPEGTGSEQRPGSGLLSPLN